MESPNPRDEPRPAPFGIARDIQRVKTDSAATAAELREFLGQMRGKRPQEVLGLVAGSGLAKSMLAATLGCLLLMVALTVIPYFLYHRGPKPAPKAAAPKPAAIQTAPATATAATPPAAQAGPPTAHETVKSAPPAGTSAPPANVERAIKAMGMDETKMADPKKNPLEKSLDKLLDKVQ
jgi:hypothetical protein